MELDKRKYMDVQRGFCAFFIYLGCLLWCFGFAIIIISILKYLGYM